MAINRDKNRRSIENNNPAYVYSNIYRRRRTNNIIHFASANLVYPTPEQISNLRIKRVLWETGTKYYNLANQFYDDPEYWWVIAFFNFKPLESDNRPGDIILVPTPLSSVLRYMGHSI